MGIGGGGGGEIPVTPVNPIVTTTDAPDSAEPMEVDEDVLLQQALAMSMAEEMHVRHIPHLPTSFIPSLLSFFYCFPRQGAH